jgi:TATA-binding protein-associated factor Taf7
VRRTIAPEPTPFLSAPDLAALGLDSEDEEEDNEDDSDESDESEEVSSEESSEEDDDDDDDDDSDENEGSDEADGLVRRSKPVSPANDGGQQESTGGSHWR